MKSLQLTEFGKKLEWRTYETPQPQGSEILLKVAACGVCHSDLHIWEGYYELGDEKRIYVKDRGVQLPLTMGHEIVGTVVACGPDVNGVSVGEARLVYPWIGCGSCKYCDSDRPQMCLKPRSLGVYTDGGYSDYVLIPNARYLIDITGIRPEVACSYACAGLTAYSALKKTLPLESDETLVLIGAGGLGMMAVQVVRALTSARVIVLDVDDVRLAKVRDLADVETINSRHTDPVQAILSHTGGRGADAVIDFVNNGPTANAAFGMLGKNGILVMVGLFGGMLHLSTPVPALKNLTIRGSYTGSLIELRELIDLVRVRRLESIPVATYPLGHAAQLLEDVREGKIVGRAVLTPDAGAVSL